MDTESPFLCELNAKNMQSDSTKNGFTPMCIGSRPDKSLSWVFKVKSTTDGEMVVFSPDPTTCSRMMNGFMKKPEATVQQTCRERIASD
jgi:CRISPR/Cas system endoribonuclease Cas6 (RAMP superfamily)